jgi:two-component system OmpR family response regulator
MKLLYVEDEADIRSIAEFALEDEGFDIIFCESGEQAVACAADFMPDVIVIEVMMPGMDGPTTLKNIRKIAGLQTTPIIFLTAKVQPTEIQSFIALGALEVIAKPFDPMTLPEQIRTILNR